jgi:hypothetical protein
MKQLLRNFDTLYCQDAHLAPLVVVGKSVDIKDRKFNQRLELSSHYLPIVNRNFAQFSARFVRSILKSVSVTLKTPFAFRFLGNRQEAFHRAVSPQPEITLGSLPDRCTGIDMDIVGVH